MRNPRFAISLLTTLLLTLLLGACHTIEGAGKDISAAGEEIEETARDTRTG